MTPPLFIVVTDAHFFPGALVAVASILAYHSTARIVVVESGILGKKLSGCQKSMLKALGAEVDETGVYGQGDRKQGAWELKAYAAERYADQAPVIVGIDADCTLCGPVDDILLQCERTGEFLGGKDGDGVVYDKSYEPYGFPVPARNDAYMSTSLYFCKTTQIAKEVLAEWADCCAKSVFGSNGIFHGHGDQGVLNAILYKRRADVSVRLLENDLWSQHWVYWQRPLEIRDGRLFNLTLQKHQRSLHGSGGEKPWDLSYRARLEKYPHVQVSYAWFLAFLERAWKMAGTDPAKTLEVQSQHLIRDLDLYRGTIEQLVLDGPLPVLPGQPLVKRAFRQGLSKKKRVDEQVQPAAHES